MKSMPIDIWEMDMGEVVLEEKRQIEELFHNKKTEMDKEQTTVEQHLSPRKDSLIRKTVS